MKQAFAAITCGGHWLVLFFQNKMWLHLLVYRVIYP